MPCVLPFPNITVNSYALTTSPFCQTWMFLLIHQTISDPFALAQTLHALSGPETKIYISGKSRLDKPHEEFDVELSRLFRTVKKFTNHDSRMRNPGVFIIFAEGKI